MKHKKGQWIADEPAADSARRELCRFATAYFAAGRKVARKGISPARLHEFRLATKHFRYLLELFQPLYGKRLDNRIKQLKHFQTVLGELNDYVTTETLLSQSSANDDVGKLLHYLQDERRKKRRAFRELWKTGFDSAGEEQNWLTTLDQPLRRVRQPRTNS